MVQKIRAMLWGLGILMLLAAAFDLVPVADNTMIFLALACFIISAVIKRAVKKSEGCCK